jgi:hypothetical protein
MNLARHPLPFNQTMRAAYKAVGVPLWVTPQEAADRIRAQHWSEQISIELGQWFARIWSMAFASGYRGLKPLSLSRLHVLRVLSKMGYESTRAAELADLLLYNLDGLHTKGCERKTMQP